MKSAQGILTVRGGMTSHAAVVARGMGTCCVSGCGEIAMDEENKKFTLAGKEFHEGDCISLDGSTGNIYDGIIPTVDATIAGEFGRIMGWADKYRTLKVRTNADTPADAKKARELGAEGIGLCRTEHMFFEGDRIDAFREMICSETVEREKQLLRRSFRSSRETLRSCMKLLKETRLLSVSWIRRSMSSFLLQRKISRNLLTLRAKLLSRSRLSLILCMSSTR